MNLPNLTAGQPKPRKTLFPSFAWHCHLPTQTIIFLFLFLSVSLPLSPAEAMGKRPPYPSDIEAARYPPPPPPTFRPPPPRHWTPWLVPLIFVSNVAMFVYTMYLNDCPSRLDKEVCLFADHLGRFSFQPFKENPLLGPSTST